MNKDKYKKKHKKVLQRCECGSVLASKASMKHHRLTPRHKKMMELI